MENFFDYLIPIIFVAVFVLSKLFGPKEEGEDEPMPPVFRREHDEDEEENERARQLREEIRQKIEERKQQAAQRSGQDRTPPQQQPAPVPVSRQQSDSPSYQELLEQKRRQIEQTQQAAEAIRKSSGGALPRSAYENTRRVSRTDISSLGRSQRQSTYDVRARTGRPQVASEAVALLRSPSSARKGVILREILDKPSGLRFGAAQDRNPTF